MIVDNRSFSGCHYFLCLLSVSFFQRVFLVAIKSIYSDALLQDGDKSNTCADSQGDPFCESGG